MTHQITADILHANESASSLTLIAEAGGYRWYKVEADGMQDIGVGGPTQDDAIAAGRAAWRTWGLVTVRWQEVAGE